MNRIKVYDGLIVTCIITKKIPQTDDDKYKMEQRVTFAAEDGDAKKAVFLKNVELADGSGDTYGKRIFEATEVDIREANEIVNQSTEAGKGKPLFCIHGFNAEPGYAFNNYDRNKEDDDKTGSYNQARHRFEARSPQKGTRFGYFPIPVLWPNSGEYKDDTEIAVKAGDALRTLLNDTETIFPNGKALLCHSMGHQVLCQAAKTNEGLTVKFDNIFMVAADIDYDIFNKEPEAKKGLWSPDTKRLMAKNIFNMLKRGNDNKPVGKIHVLYNRFDKALIGSSWLLNSQTRLGSVGVKKEWHVGVGLNWSEDNSLIVDKYKNYIDNKDCSSLPMEDSFFPKYTYHSYQFETWAIDFYEDSYV